MRLGIIFGLTHAGKVAVVAGPGNPDELNKAFKEAAAAKEHGEYSEIHFHEIQLSAGRKRAAFAAPQVETEEGEALDDLTIEQLHDLGDEEGVDLTGCKLKQDYIDRIRAFRSLNEKTIEDLKQFAGEEQIDVSGSKVKKDFVNTIAAAHREKAAASTT